MDSVAPLRRSLLQHAPSCFNGKETGDDSREPGTAANVTKTAGKPEAIIIPTAVGPMMEANRSQAVATPTASARTRVG